MSDEKKDGGPAFPVTACTDPGDAGMTLRDWFAGQALAGISANTDLSRESYINIAQWAYEQADAMIKERSK